MIAARNVDPDAKYFHKGAAGDFSQLKDTGLAGKIRTAAILLDSEHYDENPGPGVVTLHQWADGVAALQTKTDDVGVLEIEVEET